MFRDIRRKPKHIRQQYAFWSAAAVTAVIALVWTVSLPSRFEDAGAPVADEAYTGAFARFIGEAKENVANVFSAHQPHEPTPEEPTATTTAATGTPFTLTPRATSTAQKEVRIDTAPTKDVRVESDARGE
jgi:hypothetical protein